MEPFLGMWALSLDYENSNAGWLEIRQEDGYLDGDILWRWGSVNPVDFVFMLDDYLVIARSSEQVLETDEGGRAVRVQRPLYWYDVYTEGKDRIRGLEAGANYYLTKGSFHDETLLNAVVDLIGKADR